ncbi:MAG: hypothetical protein LBC88_03255 [Spirochaetaceae bacterium]|jgi:hypothetical protein|nr:hypothetical protein [Spirochaetaceae bacterium]
MASKRRRLCRALCGLCLLSSLAAQEGNYRLDRSEGAVRFFQRLAWAEQAYVYRYEVLIEREEGGGFRELSRDFTGERFIEVSLPPGRYRYRVTPWDLLDRPGEPSEWSAFEVLIARDPELREFAPHAFFLDEGMSWVLTVNGRNLEPGAEVYLRHPETERQAIRPEEYTSSGTSARLVFNLRSLAPGDYEVYVKNPGGLDTSLGVFAIAFRKPVDFYAALGYAPLFPVYGALTNYMGGFLPLGAAVRAGIIPLKRVTGFLGVELAAYWHYVDVSLTDTYGTPINVNGHIANGQLNMVFQKWLPNRVMSFSVRVGGGAAMFISSVSAYSGIPATAAILAPLVGGGVSFSWLVRRPLFIEAGVDFSHWLTEDGLPPGYIRPWLGAGLLF